MTTTKNWILVLLATISFFTFLRSASAQGINPGDIVLADQNNGGRIVKVDGATGAVSVISQGGFLYFPRGVTFDQSLKYIYVTERFYSGNGVIRIDAVTGEQSVVSRDNLFSLAADLAFDSNGDLLVADYYSGVVRVNITTGAQQLVTPPGTFQNLSGIVVNPNGEIYTADYQSWPTGPGRVLKINPLDGSATTVSEAGLLQAIPGMEIDLDGSILLACVDSVVRVDPISGAQSTVISFAESADIGIDPLGNYVICDFNTGNILRYDRSGVLLETITQVDAQVAGFAVVPSRAEFPIKIDIAPNRKANVILVNSNGRVGVAVLGGANLDVSRIDTQSIRFGVTGKEALSLMPIFRDVNRDGFHDLVASFKIRDTGITRTTTTMWLECQHSSLGSLRGSDSVTPKR